MVRYQVSVDCADPDRMARFWAEALHYRLQPPPGDFESWADYWRSIGLPEEEVGDGYDAIIDPTGDGPRIWFQQVPERATSKNRLHFDLLVGGGRSVPFAERIERVRLAAERLVGLGATIAREMESPDIEHFFIQMHDPEGNIFDVV